MLIYEKYPNYPPDGVIMTHLETGEETFYRSSAEAANVLAVSQRVLIDTIARNAKYKKLYQFKYFKLRDFFGPAVAKSTV